ncbi:HAD hydrolase-like protein [Candidatus Dependentiae bacterium]|nr:HAD hydrolase-like protein [Candidatus Dependentiae bacterium]
MFKKLLLYTLFCFGLCQTKEPISAICFDIETILTTDDMKASSYVGKVKSLMYATKIGHLPCQKDLFSKLEKVPALSHLTTYNNNLSMPLIFSDWLINKQPASSCLNKITSFLENSSSEKIPSIQKEVLENIAKMMLNPSALIDTQKVISSTEKLIEQLKQKGYKLYLTGNWAHLETLQKEFGRLLKNFNGIFLSGKLKALKPHQDYYDTVLGEIKINPSNILWIEKEPHFIASMKKHNFNVISYNPKDKKTIYKELQGFNISL